MKIPIKKERIFRIISTENYLTVSKIAKKTGLAKSYVSKSVKDLKEKNVIWGGEKLYVNYSNLIREWGDFKRNIFNRIKPLAVDIFFPDKIKEVIEEYVVSGPFAEMLIQGQSPGKPIVVYLKKDYLKIENKLKKLGRMGRGYVLFYIYDEDIFNGSLKIKGWNIASIPQVCADLIAMGTYADLGFNLFEKWLNAGRRI